MNKIKDLQVESCSESRSMQTIIYVLSVGFIIGAILTPLLAMLTLILVLKS